MQNRYHENARKSYEYHYYITTSTIIIIIIIIITTIFTARCYASAVLAMGLCLFVCLSVCPSVTSRSSTKTAEGIGLVFGM